VIVAHAQKVPIDHQEPIEKMIDTMRGPWHGWTRIFSRSRLLGRCGSQCERANHLTVIRARAETGESENGLSERGTRVVKFLMARRLTDQVWHAAGEREMAGDARGVE